MNPFKAGDRVRMYYNDSRFVNGTVKQILSEIVVLESRDIPGIRQEVRTHYKCCRRLKIKKRRIAWVRYGVAFPDTPDCVKKYRPRSCHHDDPSWCDDKCFESGWVKFVEAK